MRAMALGLAIVLLGGIASAQDKPAANRDDPAVKAIIANERALYDAVVSGDKATENMRVTMLDANAAIVLYTRTVDGTFGGTPLAPIALASTTWTKRDGQWLAVHHQETDLLR